MKKSGNSTRRLLKFITCGSVDDGKSTLIGHLLYDAKLLYADQETALELESKIGSNSGNIDYSLLLDGLLAEREQKITIDVAYRFFSTNRRSFIVADTPGHEEYTRNMAVGASFADLAVILVDATKGIVLQTLRHIRICMLMGINHFVVAVNKMDLVNYSKRVFDQISNEVIEKMKDHELGCLQMIPVSATQGDNITVLSSNMTWYHSVPLLDFLETVEIGSSKIENGFIMPVQRVCRPDQSFRGFQGHIESGEIEIGDEVTILPRGEHATIQKLYSTNQVVDKVSQGQAATIGLNREIDVSRGCVITQKSTLRVAKLFRATVLWMDDKELVQGREFFLKLGTKVTPAVVVNLKCKLDIDDQKELIVSNAQKNDIVLCDLSLNEDIACCQFEQHRVMGSFILIDRVTNMTSGCGRIEYFLRRGENLTWQQLAVTRDMRSKILMQKPLTLWFTGLSGAGKSTLANAVELELHKLGKHTMLLDGDNIRMGLNRNLGFEEKDRVENIRRIAEVSKLMNDAGLIVLSAFISPYRCDREKAKEIIGEDCFVEIYVSTPLSECERRDVKGLYKKARRGEIPNFTGISSPYEPPKEPNIRINTLDYSIEDAVAHILEYIF